MAVDSRQSRANQVCINCKARKKKCDKAAPCCSYCLRKGLKCAYGSLRQKDSNLASHTIQAIQQDLAASGSSLYLQAQRLIRSTGLFMDDISSGYFQDLHQYFPFISRRLSQKALIDLGATQSVDFSILLLCMCLVTPSYKHPRSLELAIKSLFAQAQASANYPPSIHLIQASILLALYDYARDRPDQAFTAIAGSARMGYAAGLHLCGTRLTDDSTDGSPELRLRDQQAANTWWAIIICERMFHCEVTIPGQPLSTVISHMNAHLPIEPLVLEQDELTPSHPCSLITVSSLSSTNVGAFGRTTQAVWLLDQIFKAFQITDYECRSNQLNDIDATLQQFLAVLLQESNGKRGPLCEAIAIVIRALFTLHGYILAQNKSKKCCERSLAALEAATKIILDIMIAHKRSGPMQSPSLPPTYFYMIRATCDHVTARKDWQDEPWLRTTEETLRASLDSLC